MASINIRYDGKSFICSGTLVGVRSVVSASHCIDANGELWLVASNTFGGYLDGQVSGAFGTYFGGILLNPYADFLRGATDNQIVFVPEPESIALLAMGALLLLRARRRSTK